jgi:hypothetical protein
VPKPVSEPAPVFEKPAPAPEPRPPVSAPAPAPAADDPAALWSAIAAEFGRQRPLLQSAIASFTFKEQSGGTLRVVLRTDRTTRQNLLTPRNEDLLQELARKKLGAQGVIEVVFEEQAPPPSAAPEPAAAAPSGSKAAPKKEAAAAAGPIPGKEEFLNDPLIKQALEAFDARLVEVKG